MSGAAVALVCGTNRTLANGVDDVVRFGFFSLDFFAGTIVTRGYFCPRFDASARELTDDRAERWVDGAIWSRLAAETCALKEQIDNHR